MCSDIEVFVNLIYMTDYIKKLIFGKVDKYSDLIEILDWNKYKDIQEIINLNNKDINNAIQEILENERFVKIINEDTTIDLKKIKNIIK